jgi:hypothetical protein
MIADNVHVRALGSLLGSGTTRRASSIPDEAIAIFETPNESIRTMALG